MVQPWQRIARQRITQTFSPKRIISFPTLGEEDGTEGPMIIEADMGGHCVHRIYVDGGSSSEILYEYCFSKFLPEIKNQLIPTNTPLVGFNREIIWPLGQISLLVKIGDEEHSTSAWMNFMVVRSPSLYNGIIGRLKVRKIQAIPYTAHEMIKFPVAGGIVTLRSSRIIPLECSMVSEPGVPRLLRRHLNVFAYKPADMTRVPRHIAEHMINVHEGCLPVRQKNRRQAPERNKAISEEVKKLVEADIMKEARYHSWISKPSNGNKMDADGLRVYPNKVEAVLDLPEKEMKQFIAELPMLTAPREKEELIMYLAAAKEAISAVLMTERDGKQVPIYFVSRALQGLEIKHTSMKKLILALYRPRTLVKGQILADFIVERPEDDTPDTLMKDREELPDPWILFTDGSSCIDGSEAGLIITNSEGMDFIYALRFRFNATNNEAEYEALIAGLRITGKMGVQNLQANVNTKLVANQGPGKVKFLIVAMDYFTKWIEARPVATITGAQVKKFVWDNIICKFCLLGEMVSDNGKQFRDNPFKDWCEKLKAVIPAKIGMPTLRSEKVDMIKNNKALGISLDLLEEKRKQAAVQEARSKAKMKRYYNARVRNTSFRPGDFVYRNNKASHAKDGDKLGSKWEGPYEVTEALGKGAYRFRDRNGHTLPRTWNICNLKKCYMHEM
nr:reverse transcriptase domain-containing protein [Tanacetum cinerariifolium]